MCAYTHSHFDSHAAINGSTMQPNRPLIPTRYVPIKSQTTTNNNQNVYIQVWRTGSASGGTFQMCAFEPSIPVNVDCANATAITVGGTCSYQTFTNEYAGDSGDGGPSCGFYNGTDVWFSLTVPGSGKLVIDQDTDGLTNTAMVIGAALLLAPIGLDAWALRGFGLSLEWVLAIAHTFQTMGAPYEPQLPPMPEVSLVIFVMAMAVYTLPLVGRWKAIIIVASVAIASAIWMWTATDRIHWAPSGDLFLEHASGRVDRLLVREGEGLSPLRFADREADGVVRSQSCLQVFGDVGLDVCAEADEGDVGNAKAVTTISIQTVGRSVDGPPPMTIHWRDVLRENGITLERRGTRFVKKHKPDCGQRPWRPCPVERP